MKNFVPHIKRDETYFNLMWDSFRPVTKRQKISQWFATKRSAVVSKKNKLKLRYRRWRASRIKWVCKDCRVPQRGQSCHMLSEWKVIEATTCERCAGINRLIDNLEKKVKKLEDHKADKPDGGTALGYYPNSLDDECWLGGRPY